MIAFLLSEHAYLRVNEVLIFAGYAVSLNLLLGYAGQLSIAHATFGGIGGFSFAFLAVTHDINPGIALAVGILLATGLGAVVALPASRLSAEWMILLTYALASVFVTLVPRLKAPNLGGQYGIRSVNAVELFGLDVSRPSGLFRLAAGVFALVAWACWRCAASPYGRVLKGLREDPIAARSLAKNTSHYQVGVFAVTSGMAALVGVVSATHYTVAATSLYSFAVSITVFTMVIVGGAASLWGSIVGATLLVLIGPLLEQLNLDAAHLGSWQQVIYGLILIAVMRFLPRGLIPEGIQGRARWWQRFSRRRPTSAISTADDTELVARQLAGRSLSSDPSATARLRGEGGRALVVDGVCKRFGAIVAADELTFTLSEGIVTGLVGANGAGKTTVFNLITGALAPDRGRVLVDGRDVTGLRPHQIAGLGVVRTFQDVRLFARLTARENVMMAVPHQVGDTLHSAFARRSRIRRSEASTAERADEWLHYVGLNTVGGELAGALSFGEQKLVAIARALATDARVLLLDEPTSGVEGAWVDRIIAVIRDCSQRGRTICIVEHNLHVVEQVADTVIFMETGRITASGRLDELMSHERLAEIYFG